MKWALPRRRKEGRRDCFGRSIPADFTISFRRDALAESLWQYGEDELGEAALALSDEELHEVHRLAVWHHVNDPDPKQGAEADERAGRRTGGHRVLRAVGP